MAVIYKNAQNIQIPLYRLVLVLVVVSCILAAFTDNRIGLSLLKLFSLLSGRLCAF